MSKKLIKLYKLILTFSMIAIIFLVIKTNIENIQKTDNYSNLIDLKLVCNIKLNENISKKWVITEEGKVFCVTPNGDEINILDLNNSKILKSISLKSNVEDYNIVSDGYYVYFNISEKLIYKINIETLTFKLFELNGSIYTNENIVYNNKLIVGNGSFRIKVIDLNNGNVISSKKVSQHRFIQVNEGILYCYGEGNSIYAYDINNLNLIWEYVESTSKASPGISFDNNIIYFNNTYETHILDAKTGKKIKSYRMFAQDISFKNGYLFGVEYGENISRFNPENGEIIWSKAVNRGGYNVIENFYIVNDRNDYKLKKYDIDKGTLIWSEPFLDRTLSRFEVFNEYYIGKTFRGGIHLINSETGQELWRYKTYTSKDQSNYKVYKGKLVITDGSNSIKIYQLP